VEPGWLSTPRPSRSRICQRRAVWSCPLLDPLLPPTLLVPPVLVPPPPVPPLGHPAASQVRLEPGINAAAAALPAADVLVAPAALPLTLPPCRRCWCQPRPPRCRRHDYHQWPECQQQRQGRPRHLQLRIGAAHRRRGYQKSPSRDSLRMSISFIRSFSPSGYTLDAGSAQPTPRRARPTGLYHESCRQVRSIFVKSHE